MEMICMTLIQPPRHARLLHLHPPLHTPHINAPAATTNINMHPSRSRIRLWWLRLNIYLRPSTFGMRSKLLRQTYMCHTATTLGGVIDTTHSTTTIMAGDTHIITIRTTLGGTDHAQYTLATHPAGQTS